MSQTKELIYLSNSVLDSKAANSVHVMSQCSAFARLGYKVLLLGISNTRDMDYFSTYGCETKFEIKAFSRGNIKYLSPVVYAVKQLFNIVSKKNNTICYGRCPITSLFALIKGYTLIFEAHEVPHNLFVSFFLKLILSHSNLKGLVCISKGLQDDLLATYRLKEGAVKLIAHDGANVPTSKYFPLDIFEKGPNAKVIGYAGGLRSGNGIELILKLASINPQYGFVFAGGEEDEIKGWKRKFDLPNVIWLGKLDPAQVSGFLNQCDILMAPYQPGPKTGAGRDTSRWMSPLKLFEYMAANKPIMISDFPVLREVVSENEVVLLPTDNLEAWNSALKNLLSDKGLSELLSTNSYQVLIRNYTWDKRAELITSKFGLIVGMV